MNNFQRYAKYGNSKTEYNGVTYDSKREAEYARDLDILQSSGVIKTWERQPVFPLQPRFIKNKKVFRPIRYIADFKVTYPDGRIEIIDIKGFETPQFKIKEKMFHFNYPDLDLLIIK